MPEDRPEISACSCTLTFDESYGTLPPAYKRNEYTLMNQYPDILNGLSDALRVSALRSTMPTFSVSDNAPDNHADMQRAYSTLGRLVIWPGGSDRTVWGDARANWLFRAWHDWTHIRSGACRYVDCFTPEEERYIANVQYQGQGTAFSRILQIEIADQATHYERTGQFIDDQIAFAVQRLKEAR